MVEDLIFSSLNLSLELMNHYKKKRTMAGGKRAVLGGERKKEIKIGTMTPVNTRRESLLLMVEEDSPNQTSGSSVDSQIGDDVIKKGSPTGLFFETSKVELTPPRQETSIN